jgi:hypothetical protein
MEKRIVDLDEARLARAELQAKAPEVKLGGKVYLLPNELSWSIVEAASSNDTLKIVEAVKDLFGDQWDDFKSNNLSVADLLVLIEQISNLYVSEPGK